MTRQKQLKIYRSTTEKLKMMWKDTKKHQNKTPSHTTSRKRASVQITRSPAEGRMDRCRLGSVGSLQSRHVSSWCVIGPSEKDCHYCRWTPIENPCVTMRPLFTGSDLRVSPWFQDFNAEDSSAERIKQDFSLLRVSPSLLSSACFVIGIFHEMSKVTEQQPNRTRLACSW